MWTEKWKLQHERRFRSIKQTMMPHSDSQIDRTRKLDFHSTHSRLKQPNHPTTTQVHNTKINQSVNQSVKQTTIGTHSVESIRYFDLTI